MTTENTQQPDMERVMARIRKLLALANDAGAGEHERDNALRAAHATLAKYNLDMAQVEAAGANATEHREQASDIMHAYPWARLAARSVAHLYFCYHYVSRHHKLTDKCYHVFVGKTSNVTTAKEMSAYVIKSILKEANKRMRDVGQTWAWHTSFCKGAADRIEDRCNQIRRDAEAASRKGASTGTSLVLASVYKLELENNMKFLESEGVELDDIKSRQKRALAHAFEEGRNYGARVSLVNQVGGPSSSMKRLEDNT